MFYEDAIKDLEPTDGSRCPVHEARTLAIWAIRKQIQTKPTLCVEGPEQWLQCDRCGTLVEDFQAYCGGCGQAQDWSEFDVDDELDAGEEAYLDHLDIRP